MSAIAAEVVPLSPLFVRTARKRVRKPRDTPQDRLIDEALSIWIEYVRMFLLPRDPRAAASMEIGSLFETTDNCYTPRSRRGPANPTLAHAMADEDQLWAWPKTIHMMIVELPRTHRCALLGSALGLTQAQVGQNIGVTQQRVQFCISEARRSLAITLAVYAHVRGAHDEVMSKKLNLY